MSVAAPLGWVAGFGGAYLIYAAISNTNPIAALSATLTDNPSAVRPIADSAPPAGTTSRAFTVANAAGYAPVATASPADVAAATAIVNGGALRLGMIGGGHRLAAPAAAGYQRAVALLGRSIPVTDSYRTIEQQTAAYASDPERFAPPARSLHPKGLAIDVNGTRINLADPQLISALSRAGWAQTALPAEPWHWSFGVRG